MNKSDIIEKIAFKPHLRDYTYAVLFFSLSSFFAFFVIKPVLTIAFTLRREAIDLRSVNAVYEKNILTLVEIQSKMESLRDRMYIIDDALPRNPQTKQLITGINLAAQEQGVGIRNISISPIDLKNKGDELKPIMLSININGDFTQAGGFVKLLLNQRRIKTIESVKFTKLSGTDSIPVLQIQMAIDAYYL